MKTYAMQNSGVYSRNDDDAISNYEFRKLQHDFAISMFEKDNSADYFWEIFRDSSSESYLKMNESDENDLRFRMIANKHYGKYLEVPNGYPIELHVDFLVLLCMDNDTDDTMYMTVKPTVTIFPYNYDHETCKKYNSKLVDEFIKKFQKMIDEFKNEVSSKIIEYVKKSNGRFFIEDDLEKIRFFETEYPVIYFENDVQNNVAITDVKQFFEYKFGLIDSVKNGREVQYNKVNIDSKAYEYAVAELEYASANGLIEGDYDEYFTNLYNDCKTNLLKSYCY